MYAPLFIVVHTRLLQEKQTKNISYKALKMKRNKNREKANAVLETRSYGTRMPVPVYKNFINIGGKGFLRSNAGLT